MEEAYEELANRIMQKLSTLREGERIMIGVAGMPGSGKSTLAKAVVGRINHLVSQLQWQQQQAASSSSDTSSGSDTSSMSSLDEGSSTSEDNEAAQIAVVVPMDGYHYTKAQLRAMPDPDEKFARRGAHWTFDGEAFYQCLKQIRETGEASVPGFDHGVGDPCPGQISVNKQHKVIVVEGNYVLYDQPPWNQIRPLFDEGWYVDCNLERAMDRVYLR